MPNKEVAFWEKYRDLCSYQRSRVEVNSVQMWLYSTEEMAI